MRLYYREVDPLPKAPEQPTDDGDSTKAAGDSEESKDDEQKEENQEQDKTTSEEASETQEESSNGDREDVATEREEEQLIAEMDGEESSGEKMEDSRTEEKS